VEIFELRFGRLTRGSDPIVEATPVIDGFRVGHEISSYEGRAVNIPARFELVTVLNGEAHEKT
jgi:hypothetical protein